MHITPDVWSILGGELLYLAAHTWVVSKERTNLQEVKPGTAQLTLDVTRDTRPHRDRHPLLETQTEPETPHAKRSSFPALNFSVLQRDRIKMHQYRLCVCPRFS